MKVLMPQSRTGCGRGLRLCPTFAAILNHWSSSDKNGSHWSSTTANLNMGAQSGIKTDRNRIDLSFFFQNNQTSKTKILFEFVLLGLAKIIHTLIISIILLSEHCQAFDRSQSKTKTLSVNIFNL